MQSHRTFSLKIKVNIVISAILAAALMCGCAKKEQTVFSDTVYASGGTYSVEGGDGEDSYSAKESGSSEGQKCADPTNTAQNDAGSGSEIDNGTICVFVCGAVNCEGVYELPEKARVIDAVEAAGGYSDDADRTYVNQAEYVYDTQRVEIPTVEEAQLLREYDSSGSEDDRDSQSDNRIDLNTADKQALMTLPGIGESKADRILEYRQIHGRFSSTEELMNVSGIGSGVYEKIKEYIKV